MKVLIIEDDFEAAELTQKGLSAINAEVTVLNNGNDGLRVALQNTFDCIILDIMLPGLDGFSFVQQLRAQKINTPILIASALKEIEDRIRGLQLGGDDYITKPFVMAELQMRVKALVRRATSGQESTQITFSDVVLNKLNRSVTRNSKLIELQEKEFALLDLFMSNPGKIMNKNIILKHVWNYDFDPNTNVVDVLVCRLRAKLEKDFPTRLIFTVRGVGYVLKQE